MLESEQEEKGVMPLELTNLPRRKSSTSTSSIELKDITKAEEVVEALDYYPDGGAEAWIQVFCCFCLFFTTVGAVYSWGVLQKALFDTNLPVTLLALTGSLQAALSAVLAIPMSRVVASYGPRNVASVGAICFGLSSILAGSLSQSIVGLILIEGVLFGIGQSLCFFSSATLPSQYFKTRRNLATGIVYSGAGLGGVFFSLITNSLLSRFSLPWTFRILGFIFIAINLPAALTLRARLPRKPLRSNQPFIEWSLFKDSRFSLMFCAGAVSLFPLFVAPFFLPLYCTAIGISASTASLIVAGFNLASALGRVAFGFGADKALGSINSMLLCLLVTAVSTLIIWPLSHSVLPLTIFAMTAGFFGGAFFSLMPGVLSSIFGSRRLGVVFGMIVTSWSPGYLLGSLVAGLILEASGSVTDPKSYIPAIMYAGVTSFLAAGLVLE